RARRVLLRPEARPRRGRARRRRHGSRLPRRPRPPPRRHARRALAARARRHGRHGSGRAGCGDPRRRPPGAAAGAAARARNARDDGPRGRRPGHDRAGGPVTTASRPAGTALLVEDEDSIAALVRSYLERDGFTVVRATHGADALRELAERPVRVVILDVGLPDMDGFTVCTRIRAGASAVPILMLTARDEEPDRVT